MGKGREVRGKVKAKYSGRNCKRLVVKAVRQAQLENCKLQLHSVMAMGHGRWGRVKSQKKKWGKGREEQSGAG